MSTKEQTRQVLVAAAGVKMGLFDLIVFELHIVIVSSAESQMRAGSLPSRADRGPWVHADGRACSWLLHFSVSSLLQIPRQVSFLTGDVRGTSCELPATDSLLRLEEIAGRLPSPSRLDWVDCSPIAHSQATRLAPGGLWQTSVLAG